MVSKSSLTFQLYQPSNVPKIGSDVWAGLVEDYEQRQLQERIT